MNSTNITESPFPTSQIKIHLFFIPLLSICFIACYHDVLIWMYSRYMSLESYYSHGFIIPFVSGYLIWQKKEELGKASLKKSWLGFYLIIFSILLHIAGTILYIFSLSGFSIFLLIFGITLFVFGNNITGIILFPLFYLILMFPFPMALIGSISFPMKMLVAKVGAEIISILGIPISREGFHITIPAGSLLVGNPCSGLRSLISFLALGAILAYLSKISMIKKYLLCFLSLPIAILSNVIRVSILILISHFWGLAAAAPDSFWHGASGVFVFIIGALSLFCAGKILEWKA